MKAQSAGSDTHTKLTKLFRQSYTATYKYDNKQKLHSNYIIDNQYD
jgi:hypothetical protein